MEVLLYKAEFGVFRGKYFVVIASELASQCIRESSLWHLRKWVDLPGITLPFKGRAYIAEAEKVLPSTQYPDEIPTWVSID